jgi:hypothetical protein
LPASKNSKEFHAWLKFDLKDNESLLLKKLLRKNFDNDYYYNKKKEDRIKQNELMGRFTADLIIKIANKTNSNKKLLALIPSSSETKQFSTNENSTDEIVIETNELTSSTEEKTLVITSTLIYENPVVTITYKVNEEIPTQKIQENENVTTTQVATIVSSGICIFKKLYSYSILYNN